MTYCIEPETVGIDTFGGLVRKVLDYRLDDSILINGASRMRIIHSRALVAGGAGFLGSHLCDRLIEQETEVICLDNFMSGRFENIEHLVGNRLFSLIEHDVCNALPELQVDEVWNLACPASPPRYQADPVHTMLTSVMGTKHGLDLARRNKARFFQASTSEVYGDPEIHPQPENYKGCVNTIGPRACYDEGKRAAEALCFDYHRTYGVDIRVARIFNTYGPRMDPDDGRVVSNFIVKALRGQPLEIHGSGSQTRSFCYVDDLIEGFLRFMRSETAGSGPINLGNPGEFTIAELAEFVAAKHGVDTGIVNLAEAEDDPRQRKPVIDLAQSVLGWSPAVPLHEGLTKTYDHFREALTEKAEIPAVQQVL